MALSATRQRAAAYIVCAFFALAYMGNAGEFCSLGRGDCPSRLAALVAMGVLTFLFAAGLAVATALEKLPQAAEAGGAAFVALLNTCGLAVVASPHTYTRAGPFTAGLATQGLLTPALLFAIVAEVAIVLGLFYAVSDDGFDAVPRVKTVDPAPVAAAVPAPVQHVPPPQMAPPQMAPPPMPVPPPVTTVPPPQMTTVPPPSTVSTSV